MRRFVLTVSGRVREQYIVEAESAQEAQAAFDQGEYTFPVISEVHDAEVVDVTDIGIVVEQQEPMDARNQQAWRRVNATRKG